MSFGFSAATWAAIGAGVTAVGTVASADTQRKNMHKQQDALKASQEADAKEAASAEESATTSANMQQADARRRRRASALSVGAPSDALGASGSLLGAGTPTASVATRPASSVLGRAAG